MAGASGCRLSRMPRTLRRDFRRGKALGFVHGLDRGSHAMHRCWGQLDRTAMLQAPT
uniref:Uncharacterized protein n=1 Tax=Ralstonia solanacearum TaxID=305 RepID=A0A0S4X5V7_RALSL|nr:protein of unknown function [Ralstonia solanacearum]CUV35592.1 protein of unknown function [Ralstonia solanacearum]CUV39114.1 protein of unknown function [Ralstonia solanacearum]CUV59319.1 protein of unknown function [Ralstonia solanacearum]